MSSTVMISHSTKEKPIAEAICQRLEAAGFPCWIAPRNIPPGAEWTSAILTGIASSRLMVLVFSESANESRHVSREVLYAGDNKIPVLPFRVQDTVPTGCIAYYLLGVQWLDALLPPVEPHIEALVDRVRLLLPDGDTAPAPEVRPAGFVQTYPSRPEAPAPPMLTPAVLDAVTNRLMSVLGPIARHLVKSSAAQVSTLPELHRKLAEAILDKKDREAFLKACGPEPEIAAPRAAFAPPPDVVEPPSAPVAWQPEMLSRAKDGLAVYLGPMASRVVDQAARQARTVNELYDLLAAKISSPKDREKWNHSFARASD